VLIAAGAGTLAWFGRAPPLGNRRRRRPWLYRAAPLLMFFAVYWIMAVNMSLNIGHRHILPTYPVFYVLAAGVALWLATPARRMARAAIAAALALHAADSFAARPFYLSYFQPLAGGIEAGHRYLVDSSYDWGQGLPDLAAWLGRLRQRGDRAPVHLTYFGADSPRARGLDVVRFGDELNDTGGRAFPAQVRGGWFVISATHFRRVYLPIREVWTSTHEKLYGEIMGRLAAAQAAGGATSANRDAVYRDAMDYELLQFMRLTFALRNRRPREVIGGSLLVFRLSDAEVAAALYGPPPFPPGVPGRRP
jgi:hypothetical protein